MNGDKLFIRSDAYDFMDGHDTVISLPFLVKGKLVVPQQMSKDSAAAAFNDLAADEAYAQTAETQIIREKIIDRLTRKYTGEYFYQIMPKINPLDLIERDMDNLAAELYSLTVDEILDYLESVLAWLSKQGKLALRVRELCRQTSEYPDSFIDSCFVSLTAAFNREQAAAMIDNELSHRGRPGRDFLNDWVEVSSLPSPAAERFRIRAMPTRQLHITAGNVPEVPIVSALRAILTKSSAVIKLPYGATLPGALLGIAACEAAPNHPITKHLSMVYWHGGDESIESALFQTGAFDRIVVWGSPQTITSIRAKVPFTRVIAFNPRYSVSLIGKEAFKHDLSEIAEKGAADALIFNQKACTSSLVHYVEGTDDDAGAYAELLRCSLERWDTTQPGFITPATTGQIKRMRRGRYADSRWFVNQSGEAVSSCVLVATGSFDILDHPMSRMIVVRPLAKLEDALPFIHSAVSVVGVYPEERRSALIDRILARGVSSVVPLGQGETIFAGMPHDGMFVLNELVDWKVA